MAGRRNKLCGRDRVWLLATTVAGVLLVGGVPNSQVDDRPSTATSSNAIARRWFEDAKFGMFIHWGVYSLLGKGEWVMNNDKLPISEYAKLPPHFNPVKFDAEEWVKLAKAAGMKYITVTAKHHDGFCMFDSKLTSYDIVDATPYGKDPMKALASACHKQGLKLFFYYSLLDWHHPDYFPRGGTGQTAGREEKGDWTKYVAYYQGQVRELCTNYGELGGFWFDGWWDRPQADWDLKSTYRLIHELQPGGALGKQPSCGPVSWRGLSDLRARPARRQLGRIQQGGCGLPATPGDLSDHEPVVGLQRPRHPVQEPRTGDPRPARRGRARCQSPPERRAQA